ncbi:MAG: SUMF1/EgtB/PvdO family nonheme iron enzyme [Caldilineales bacterium]|nr:SUMF1/EgtB/PvdO family nonheme iron enzyme [Caldilineales bacterium]
MPSIPPDSARLVTVPAGPFIYGPEIIYERQSGARPALDQTVIDLPEFRIQAWPVTYAEWHTFLNDSGYEWPGVWWAIREKGWRRHLRRFAVVESYPQAMADYPIVFVSQTDALVYADWLGERDGLSYTLPTEQQWEKAARSVDGRTYPWGETSPRPELMHLRPTHTLGLDYYWYNLTRKPRTELARSGWYWRIGTPLPVGAIPQNRSPYGCLDMAGNIWEWTLSPYDPADGRFHVVKGGSWGYSPHHTACSVRSACSITQPSSDYRAQGTGFRLVVNES